MYGFLGSALSYAKKLKWKWAGHVARLKDERWTSRVTTWKGPIGKRRQTPHEMGKRADKNSRYLLAADSTG